MRNFVVAIDGPSGTGKSTTARILADKLKSTLYRQWRDVQGHYLFSLEEKK